MACRRNITPPTTAFTYDVESNVCLMGSASTTASSYRPHDQHWSPDSTSTAATTPPRSPRRVRECGPLLLPRVRPQDQLFDPAMAVQMQYGHNRTVSLPLDAYPVQYGVRSSRHMAYPHIDKRSASPVNRTWGTPPAAPISPYQHMINDTASMSRKPSVGHSRANSSSHTRSHSRSTSSSSIDASMLSRYGYPTYRQSPMPQAATTNSASARLPSAMSHLAPIPLPNGRVPSYPDRERSDSPAVKVAARSCEVQCEVAQPTAQTSTALEYLTAANPAPGLTRRTVDSIRGQHTHFWYDVRNVRVWSDFNVATIAAIPDLLKLLQFPVSTSELPIPTRVSLSPENAVHLAEICASHHAVKVNAALRLTQGSEKHMVMRALRPQPGSRQQPEFVSSYQIDRERTMFGDERGRVIGIVKCFEQWNSGMRAGEAPEKVKYLRGLAQLHRFMREHGTRYGFIMTEIELVCVRAGGTPASGSNVPLFGFLEVAKPVDISASGPGENGNLKMTVGLALWWLHMLAKEQPMPNQLYWRMDVGAPGARTRQYHLKRDEWMPKAIGMDTREAKRVRGWVWPDEPLSKRECGKGRKVKAI